LKKYLACIVKSIYRDRIGILNAMLLESESKAILKHRLDFFNALEPKAEIFSALESEGNLFCLLESIFAVLVYKYIFPLKFYIASLPKGAPKFKF